MNYICMDEKLNSELKLDIFSRLPVESVIRCRCVSKSWCSILNDPHFVHMHTQKLLVLDQGEDDQKNEHSMSFVTGNVVNGLKFVRAMRVVNLVICSYIEPKSIIMESSFSTFLSKDDDDKVDIVGSCNGLVCLLRGNSHMILNPVTKEILFIPYDSKINYKKDHGVSDGFGYHPSTKEYKIVSHRIYDDQATNETIRSVQVYTLGSGRWRNVIEMSNYDLDYSSVHINGVLYWITPSFKYQHRHNYQNEPKMIMSFDLASEEFQIITPILPPPSFNVNPVFQLGEWGRGCLCLIAYYHKSSSSYAEIWVLKKKSSDNDDCSWNKVTKTITLISEGGAYQYAALTKSGKVLFWHRDGILTCFDPKANSYVPLSDVQFSGRHICGVHHMKSFVSLKALGEENAERYIGEDAQNKSTAWYDFSSEDR